MTSTQTTSEGRGRPKNNQIRFLPLPGGRLLLPWVSTEAVRTQSRELILGDSLAEFMRRLDIYNDGGAMRGRLQEQMRRLFNAHVHLIYEDAHGEASVNSLVADRTEFWWNPKRPDDRTLWENSIRLGEEFFNEVIAHPVPIDVNTLRALTRSPLGLDLYLWLTYRTFGLTRPLQALVAAACTASSDRRPGQVERYKNTVNATSARTVCES